MDKFVDDLIMAASEEVDVRAFWLDNPGLTLATSGWEGFRVTFQNTIDNSCHRVALAFLPQNYRGEKDGFTLTEKERQLAYEELSLYGVKTNNLVIVSAEMYRSPYKSELEQGDKQVNASGKENVSRTVSGEKALAAVTEMAPKDNSANSKVSSWLASHSIGGADDTFAWSSKKDDRER